MSGGGVPANTSSTTTVNQSPWQNKTYRTLALGTPENLGPVAQQLKIGQQLTKDWMDIQSGRDPGLYYGLQNATPERVAQEAAMRDVGFAGGRAPTGAPEATPAAPQEQAQPQTAAEGGIMSLQRFAEGGTPKPKAKAPTWTDAQQSRFSDLTQKQQSGAKLTPQETNVLNSLTKKHTVYQNYQQQEAQPKGSAPYSYSDLATPTAFLDQATGQNMLADAQLAYQRARELGTPEQIQQATNAYSAALKGMQGVANYTPQQVQAAQAAAAQANRGDIRDIAAQQAQVERYNATHIAPTVREQGVTTAAPKTWTDPGVAQQYMNPYAQAVINQNVQEANRNFMRNLSGLRGQAAKSKAYGGSRQGLEEAEALRNQGYLIADIQDKGLSQAYQQGMGQFQAEQGLGAQVGMSNTQQINQLKSQYMQMGLTEAQANQAAMNAASQFGAAAQNQAYNNFVAQQLAAQQANQGMDWNTVNLNTSNQQQANIQNAQLAQQAALANQQAGLQANQQNIGAYGAMGSMAQGLGGLGAAQNQIQLNNLGALGQSATAQTNFAQGALDRQTQNAINYFNLPTTFNAAGINALNAQPVSGGTNQSSQWYNQARPFAKGGKVKWGPKK
jgi:hypothetical protein